LLYHEKQKVVRLVIVAILVLLLPGAIVMNIAIRNAYKSVIIETEINTDFGSRADLENSLRTLYATAVVDSNNYKKYKDSEIKSEKELSTAAFIRLQTTVAKYNEIYSKLSYYWEETKPSDLPESLDLEMLTGGGGE